MDTVAYREGEIILEWFFENWGTESNWNSGGEEVREEFTSILQNGLAADQINRIPLPIKYIARRHSQKVLVEGIKEKQLENVWNSKLCERCAVLTLIQHQIASIFVSYVGP